MVCRLGFDEEEKKVSFLEATRRRPESRVD
jgi:hypothetical protein